MARRSKTSYLTVTQTRFPDNTTGDVDPQDERNDRQDIADSFLSFEDDGPTLGTTTHTITATTTLTADHRTLFVDATAGGVTLDLPPAADLPGKRYEVIKIDASANVVTIDADGAELISGSATRTLEVQWAGYSIQSDGVNWIVISIV